MIHATINGIPVEVAEGSTIMEAAESVGIKIPTLCYLKNLMPEGSCRICMVEIVGMPKLLTACSNPIAEGNVILTESPKVIAARRGVLDLLLSNHPNYCFNCPGNGDCELQALCYQYGVERTSYIGEMNEQPIDRSNPYFDYNPNLCILCHRCVRTCHEIVKRSAIATSKRGFKSTIAAAPFNAPWIDNKECEFCGNCIQACPVGALRSKHRKQYRPWEVQRVPNTCYNCKNMNGCERYILVKDGKLMDVVAEPNQKNKGRLCNKGRFEFYDVERPEQVERLHQKDIAAYRQSILDQLQKK